MASKVHSRYSINTLNWSGSHHFLLSPQSSEVGRHQSSWRDLKAPPSQHHPTSSQRTSHSLFSSCGILEEHLGVHSSPRIMLFTDWMGVILAMLKAAFLLQRGKHLPVSRAMKTTWMAACNSWEQLLLRVWVWKQCEEVRLGFSRHWMRTLVFLHALCAFFSFFSTLWGLQRDGGRGFWVR